MALLESRLLIDLTEGERGHIMDLMSLMDLHITDDQTKGLPNRLLTTRIKKMIFPVTRALNLKILTLPRSTTILHPRQGHGVTITGTICGLRFFMS